MPLLEQEDSIGSELSAESMFSRQAALSEQQSGIMFAEKKKELDSAETIGAAVASTVAATVDTFGTSLGLLDEGTVENYLQDAYPDASQFFQEHESGVRLASDLVGLFIPAGIGVKLARSGSYLNKAANKITGKNLDRYFSTGLRNEQLFQREIEKAGIITRGIIPRTVHNDPAFKAARKKALVRSIQDTISENVLADSLIAVSMNQSDFLFPEEFTTIDHLVFFGGANFVIGAGAAAIASRAWTRATSRLGPNAAKSQNPNDFPITAATGLPDNRGGELFVAASFRDDDTARKVAAVANGDSGAAEALTGSVQALETRMSEIMRNVAQDNPVPGVTSRNVLEPEELSTLLAGLDPNVNLGMRSLEKFTGDEGLELIERSMRAVIEKDKVEFANGVAELKPLREKIEAGTANVGEVRKAEKLRKGLMARQTRMLDNEKSVFIVNEIDGTLTPLSLKKAMFQDGERKILRDADGIASINVDGVAINASATGEVRIASNIAGDELPDAAVSAVVTADSKTLLTSIGRSNEQQLRTELQQLTGGAGIEVSDDLARFRESLGNAPFTVYKSEEQPGLFSLTKTGRYQTPHTMTSDAVFGVSSKGKLIAEEAATAPLSARAFSGLSYKAQTGVYDVLQSAAENLNLDKLELRQLAGGAFGQADFAAHVLRNNPTLANKFFQGDSAGLDQYLKQTEFLALDSKFKAFQYLQDANLAKFNAGLTQELQDLPQIARQLNLPSDKTSTLELFSGAYVPGKTSSMSIIARDMPAIRETLIRNMDGVDFNASAASVVDDFAVSGNMMQLNRKRKPVVSLTRNTDENPAGVGIEQMREAVYINKATVVERLSSSDTQIVRAVMDVIHALPDVIQTMKDRLPEIVDGFKNEGILARNIATQAARIESTLGGRAIDTIAAETAKAASKAQAAVFNAGKSAINKLTNRSNAGDLRLYQTFENALARGWDVLPTPVQAVGKEGVPSAKPAFTFALDPKSARNRQMYRDIYGVDMPKGAQLPMVGKAGTSPEQLVLTEEATQAAVAVNGISQRLLKEFNALNHAKGLKQIPGKTMHAPPKNLRGKEVVYLIDNTGRVQTVRSGSTIEEATRLAQKEVQASDGKLIPVPGAQMQRYHEARNRSWFELDDFSTPGGTKEAKGTTSGIVAEGGLAEYKQMILQLERGFADAAREARLTAFGSEVNFLKLQHQAAGFKNTDQSIYSLLINRFQGTQLKSTDEIVSAPYKAIETSYDWIWQRLYDAKIGRSEASAAREFKQIEDKLDAEFNPFNSFNDFLEKTADVNIPPTLRKHAAVLNEVTAAFTIRILDAGMAAVNMASLVSTLPPVVAALKQGSNESRAEWLSRTGIFATEHTEGLASMSTTKTVLDGLGFYYSKEGRQFAQRAADLGYFDQFAAEEVRLYGSTGENFVTGLLRKSTDILSKATDYTERQARAIAFMTNANIGKRLLGLEDRAAMSFAHAQANNVIGDFRPDNRPAIFQGAAGMPFALFTTFMWNFLQRQYSMIANKQIGALVNQVGLQTAVFGAESYPGVPTFIDTFTANYDGSHTFVDRLNASMGRENAELFLNGSLSTMTGISFTPRAAVGLPGVRGISVENSAAGVRFASKIGSTIGESLKSIQENSGVDSGEMVSILARANFNKFASNALEMYQGFSEDARGNMIEEDTTNAVGLRARALGFKPFFADELRQENRRNRTTDAIRNELKQRLSDSLQNKVRTGSLTVEELDSAVSNYSRAGGSPENFRRFFVSQMVRGTTNKLDSELHTAIGNSSDNNRTSRLLFRSE